MKSLHRRSNGIWYLKKHIPADVRPAFSGKAEVWQSLRTSDRREAEKRYHAAMAAFNAEVERARRQAEGDAADVDRMASPHADAALGRLHALANRLQLPLPSFSPAVRDRKDAEFVEIALTLGQVTERPKSPAKAIELIDRALAELDWERQNAVCLSLGRGDDGEPVWAVPARYVSVLEAWIDEQFAADRRTLEALRAEFEALRENASMTVESDGESGQTPDKAASLKALAAVWEAQRKPAPTTQSEMAKAISRFTEIAGPLPYREITVEHVRRFKAALIQDTALKSATKVKQWNMIRRLMTVAKEDGLIATDPFDTIKLGRLPDDAERREDLTKADLKALFSVLKDDEWWLVRIALYTGARLGELCQLTKSDVIEEEGRRALLLNSAGCRQG